MSVPVEDRKALFKTFGRAFVKKDVELLYTVVADDFSWKYSEASGVVGSVAGKEGVLNHMLHQADRLVDVIFHDMTWYHVEEVSFVTFRITANDAKTREPVNETGIEYYTFKNGRVAVKYAT